MLKWRIGNCADFELAIHDGVGLDYALALLLAKLFPKVPFTGATFSPSRWGLCGAVRCALSLVDCFHLGIKFRFRKSWGSRSAVHEMCPEVPRVFLLSG